MTKPVSKNEKSEFPEGVREMDESAKEIFEKRARLPSVTLEEARAQLEMARKDPNRFSADEIEHLKSRGIILKRDPDGEWVLENDRIEHLLGRGAEDEYYYNLISHLKRQARPKD
jgi:hypothetical protein